MAEPISKGSQVLTPMPEAALFEMPELECFDATTTPSVGLVTVISVVVFAAVTKEVPMSVLFTVQVRA